MTKLTSKITLSLLLFSATLFSSSSQAARSVNPHGRYHVEVLEELAQKAELYRARGLNPLVIFDLDDTLYNGRSRKLRALAEVVRSGTIAREFPAEAARVEQLLGTMTDPHAWNLPPDVEALAQSLSAYTTAELLRELHLENAEFLAAIDKPLMKLFFSSEFAALDSPLPGAVAYVQKLVAHGAEIVYLTGRDEPLLGDGTRASLRRHGFPLDHVSSRLVLKPVFEMDDAEFKARALTEIATQGEVIAGFENEPANINVFQARFPHLIPVFVDSSHSLKPDVPHISARWIRDFSLGSF